MKLQFSKKNYFVPVFGVLLLLSIFFLKPISVHAATPDQITGLKLWLKADAITGLNDGDAISSWVDSSGLSNNATQATGTKQPLYKTNIINGQPVVRFDGTDDFLGFTSVTTIRTMFFVVKWTGAYNDYAPLLGHPTLFNVVGGAGDDLFEPTATSTNVLNGTGYLNGVTTSPSSMVKPTTMSILSFKTIGNVSAQYVTNDRNAAGRVWRGDFAEIIIYDSALSDTDRGAVETYLAAKYGFQVTPGTPTNLAATPGDGQVALTWDAPAPGSSAITDYTIEYKTGSNDYTPFAHSASTNTNITVTGLTNGLTYSFRVSAVNGQGTGVATSAATAMPVTNTAAAPSAVDVSIIGTPALGEVLQADYTFADQNGDSEGTSLYRWLRSDTSNGTYEAISGATGLTYAITNADLGKYFKFEVTPVSTVVPTTGSAVQTTASAATTTALDYYNHILVSGQSLSIGSAGGPPLSTTQPYNNKKLSGSNLVALTEVSVETIASAMANSLSSLTGSYDSIVTLHGLAGTAYTGLKKGTSAYANGITQVTDARTASIAAGKAYKVPALVIIHGESDHLAGTTKAQYEANLVEWQNDYDTDVKAINNQYQDVIMFTDQVSSQTFMNSATSVIPQAQLAAAENHPDKIVLVGPKYFFDYADGAHLGNVGYRWLGEYYGKVIKKVIVDGETWTPLSPNQIVRSGNTIYAKFNVPEPPLVFDTDLVDLKANYGFEYADDSSSATISAVELFNDDTVKVTLSGTPTGANQKLRYAYTGTAGTNAGAHIAGSARGNLRDSDDTESLYGNTLYNWTVHFDKNITADSTTPLVSSVAVTPNTTTAAIIWQTDEAGSSMVDYGPSSSYGSSSTEANTPTRVTTHSVSVTGLVPCTTYHYRVRSKDFAQNQGESSDSTFTTSGCVGTADVVSEVAQLVTTAAGGEASLLSSSTGINLTIPASFAAADATFQIKQLDPEAVRATTGAPSGYTAVGNYVYQLSALTDANVSVSSFNAPLTVEIAYSAVDISSLNESSLTIQRWDGTAWNALSNCTVNTGVKTVTCTTTQFSVFSLFGQTASGRGSVSGFIPRSVVVQPLLPAVVSTTIAPRSTFTTVSFITPLRFNQRGELVRQLQLFLKSQGPTIYPEGIVSGWFGPLTKQAVIRFQEKYTADVLTPLGLKRGTGYVGQMTLQKIRALQP